VFLAIEKDTTQRGCVWKCYCIFYSIVEVKFLACVLNITHHSVMHIILYANIVYFIAYVCNSCIVCISKCTLDADVTP